MIHIDPAKGNITLPLCLCNAPATVTVKEENVTLKFIEGNLDGRTVNS